MLPGSDVFVFPTLHENLSNALLEAMASGLPVVASAVGGNVEVLERGGGILVPPRDPSALAEAVVRAGGRHRASRFTGEGRTGHRAAYTLRHMAAGWDRVYTAILPESSMKVTLLGFTVPQDVMDEILARDAHMPTQTHTFAWAVVESLRDAGVDVTLLSAEPLASYPGNPKILVRGRHFEEHGIMAGSCLS